jgi:hypothetical protein
VCKFNQKNFTTSEEIITTAASWPLKIESWGAGLVVMKKGLQVNANSPINM